MIASPDRSLELEARFVADLPAAVALFDREMRYVAASPAWSEGFGLTRAPLAGERHADLSAAGGEALAEVQRRALAGERVDDCLVAEADWTRQSGTAFLSARPHRHRDGAVLGAVVVLRRAERAEEADTGGAALGLSVGLVARDEFARCLRAVLDAADPVRRGALVFAISLDNLRAINNLYGGDIGDRVENIIAERLLSSTRSGLDEGAAPRGRDVVARLGTGELGILYGPPGLPLTAGEAVAERLLRLVQGPIAVGGRSLRVAASIGYIAMTAVQREPDDVLRDLDFALQHAQAHGPSRTVAWEPALTASATRRHTLAEELRRAFDNGEFTLHYQPIVRLADDRMVGAEALLRWNHPSEGLVRSAVFVPVLDETGLIVEVGNWAVREAVRQLDSWRLLYGREIVDWISINLSARQIEDHSALLAMLRGIHDGGLSVHRLKLEIGEPALMRFPQQAAAVLAELDALGIRFLIDDFGTGAAALNGLGPYPIEAVKIDARFVAQIGSAAGEKLVEALLGIGRSHGAAIVAKGVESVVQRDFLQRSGCALAQGFLLAEPMDAALLGTYALTHADRSKRAPPPQAARA